MAVSHKTKQYLFSFAKVLVLSISFGYIYYRLRQYATSDFIFFIQSISSKNKIFFPVFLSLIILTSLNWIFEILKWKKLVDSFKKIDFKFAAKQSLAALTVSLATPGRIGDYGAKALFFKKENRKKILLLNLFSNFAQLFTTIIFGIIGLAFCLNRYEIPISKSGIFAGISGILILTILLYSTKNKIWFKSFSIEKIIQYFLNLSNKIKIEVLVFSIIRYSIFSFMFWILLQFLGAEIELIIAFPLIFLTYLLVSFLPSLIIFDVVIRGSIALWLFSFEGIPEMIVLGSVFFMWFFNFILPSLLGSFYVVKFKPVTE